MSRKTGRDPRDPAAVVVTGQGDADIRADCPCPNRSCSRHGLCIDCRSRHEKKGQAPRCER